MPSDYYSILGIRERSTYSDIRSAYRVRVKQVHPDVNEHPNAQEQFKQIKEAYNVLNNRTKRTIYNNTDHDNFVQQYGGYTSEDLNNIKEVNLATLDSKETLKIIRGADQQCDQNPERQQSRSRYSALSVRNRFRNSPKLNWIIQGRTAESKGFWAYLIRITIYLVLLYMSITIIGYILPFDITRGIAVGALLLIIYLPRIVYMGGFELIREQYIKIDNKPEPDAYTLPFSVAFGYLLVLVGTVSYVIYPDLLSGFWGLMIGGYVWIVLSVGWAAADGYYNLKHSAHPIFWNLAVQLPIMSIPLIYLIILDPLLLYLFNLVPFSVGLIYLHRHHKEIKDELYWRIQQRIAKFN